MKYIYLFGFIGTIFLANWLIGNVGYDCYPCVIPVGFGLMAPSGVLAIGLGFTLRDLAQEALGLKWIIWAIVAGALLSVWINPFLAIASGSAFLLSETLDLSIYTPLRKHNFIYAVVASNAVGLMVDSAVFLYLAFNSLNYFPGQVVGKLWMTLLVLPVIWYVNSSRNNARRSRQGSS